MKKEINKPYKINGVLYFILLSFSIAFIVIGIYLQQINKYYIMGEIIKNIAFGSFASTLVAFFIDVGSIKEKNRKYDELYQSVYFSLQFNIMKYLESWSIICSIVGKQKGYRKVKKNWMNWYKTAKKVINVSNESNSSFLFLKSTLKDNINLVENSLFEIINQKSFLRLNDLYNDKLNQTLMDLKYILQCSKIEIDYQSNNDDFFEMFDSLNSELYKIIEKWIDISFYNHVVFKPYHFYDDGSNFYDMIIEQNFLKKHQ